MPNYNVIIQPEAELDLDEAHVYLETQQTGLGFQFLTDLTEILELLEDNPLLFQKVILLDICGSAATPLGSWEVENGRNVQ